MEKRLGERHERKEREICPREEEVLLELQKGGLVVITSTAELNFR